MYINLLLYYLTLIPGLYALVGYDCSYYDANFTQIDITETKKCTVDSTNVTSRSTMIQLVQLTDNVDVTAYYCRLILHREVYHCGMSSHISAVEAGSITYPVDITRDVCLRAIREGTICIFCGTSQQIILNNLQAGQSRHSAMTFAGSIDKLGNCKGGLYSDSFGRWDEVVVSGYIKLILDQTVATASTTDDVIHLPQKIKCKSSHGHCEDLEGGRYYWDVLSHEDCNSGRHTVIYEGPANLTTDFGDNGDNKPEIITVIDADTSFSLQLKSATLICHITAYKTEHPKLLVIKKTHNLDFFFRKTKIAANSFDLFTYVNSKFVFIERNTRLNMESLYRSVLSHKCQLEQTTLDHELAIADISPVQFAYLHMGGPGYTATKLGEVIYITKCTPVEVQIRKSDRCYNELPVIYKNMSFYLTPRTRLLQKHGFEVTCSDIYTPVYKVMGGWFSINKGSKKVMPPQTLSPNDMSKDKEWKYESIHNLAATGLYSQQDLDLLRDHIMFGSEHNAIGSILVRSVQGQNPDYQDIRTINLLTQDGLEHMSQKVSEKVWGWFSVFGNISAGVIGLVSIMKVMKWIVDSIINGTILYGLFGASVKIFGCFLDSLTHCLVYKHQQKQNAESDVESGKANKNEDGCALVPLAPTAPSGTQSDKNDQGDVNIVHPLYPTLSTTPKPYTYNHRNIDP